MLRGISPLLSPELLKILCEMGHGDELLLADAHFPAYRVNNRVLRADGLAIAALLEAVLPLFVLDSPGNPLAMMQVASGDQLDPAVETDFLSAVRTHVPHAAAPVRLERSAFYQRSGSAFAVLITGETRPYGNLILTKGITT